MFFILSKILAIFVRPLTWIIIAFLLSIKFKNNKRKRISLIAGIVMLIFFSNQYIANRVMLWWEPAPVLMEEVDKYDVGIIFTGVTKGSKTPRDRVYFNAGADRVTHALQLYNDGKLKNILVSGGLGFGQATNSIAANRVKSFLTMAGVPDSVIITEPDAVNTYENAVKSADILNSEFPNQKYLLITSAFHMKRSAMCLTKQGIEFDEFPAGFFTDRPTFNFDDLFIPKGDAIGKWDMLIKEWVGIVVYKVMGYL